MIRKFLLPAAAVLLLAGCMTGGYGYRSGPGDYYYGEPGVDYRHYRSPYYGGFHGGYGYPSYYRHRWGYYGGYYGSPYYPYFPRYRYPRPDQQPQPGNGGGGGSQEPPRADRDDPPPWRNLDELRRRAERRDGPGAGPRRVVPQAVPRPSAVQRPTAQPRRPEPRSQSRGSRVEQMIRRARGGGDSDRRSPIP